MNPILRHLLISHVLEPAKNLRIDEEILQMQFELDGQNGWAALTWKETKDRPSRAGANSSRSR
jgi:hypothetical protein